jgi:putative phosphoesterase
MHIAIISDTHSRYHTISRVLEMIGERDCGLILHCGDIEDAEAVELFAGLPVHFVFGNCDHDRSGLRRAMKTAGVTLHEPFGDLEVDGYKIAWIHGDDAGLFRDLEHSDHFDFLFYGHTHQTAERKTGKTLVFNPGALHRAKVKMFAVLDTITGQLDRVVVPD